MGRKTDVNCRYTRVDEVVWLKTNQVCLTSLSSPIIYAHYCTIVATSNPHWTHRPLAQVRIDLTHLHRAWPDTCSKVTPKSTCSSG